MTFEAALRLTEILLGFALLQQSLEHFTARWDERLIYGPRALLSLALMFGAAPGWVGLALFGFGLLILARFDGPYNGGSDRMSLLTLICLTLAHLLPGTLLPEAVFGYLAIQLVWSYVLSGGVKLINPDWRNGRALRDVFQFSAYPVSEELRRFADRPGLLFVMAWSVMLFEAVFPLFLLSECALMLGLAVAALFHLANAFLFGLNRFFWAWIAAYPSILWLQQRLDLTKLL